MKKFILNIIILICIAGTGVLAAWFVKGCCGSPMSPQETVQSFYSCLFRGDWNGIRNLSIPSAEMKTYCEKFRAFREKAMKADSLTLTAATEILSNARMTFSEDRHDGRNLFSTLVTITTDTGSARARKVEMKKEGGRWLVARIGASE